MKFWAVNYKLKNIQNRRFFKKNYEFPLRKFKFGNLWNNLSNSLDKFDLFKKNVKSLAASSRPETSEPHAKLIWKIFDAHPEFWDETLRDI